MEKKGRYRPIGINDADLIGASHQNGSYSPLLAHSHTGETRDSHLYSSRTATGPYGEVELEDHTGGLIYILLFNSCISFSFNGLFTIVAVYLQDHVNFSESIAGFLTNIALAVSFLCAVLGGYLSTVYWGKYRTILVGGLTMFLGLLLLLIFSVFNDVKPIPSHKFFHEYESGRVLAKIIPLVGVFSVAVGNGIALPCMSSMLGDQFRPDQAALRSKYFSWFYWSVQIGALVASIVEPILLEYSAIGSFGLVTGVIGFGIPSFVIMSYKYKHVPVEENVFSTFFGIIKTALFKRRGQHDEDWLDKAKLTHPTQDVDDVRTTLSALKIFIPLPFFWAIYYQIFSLWVFLAEDLNRTVFGIKIPASQVIALNPMIDIFLIPFTAYLLYPFFQNYVKRPITPLWRIGIGFVACVLSLVCAGVLEVLVRHYWLGVYWIVPQFFLISCAEIFLSVTAYEFAYTQAPKKMKEMMSAMWVVTLAVGNVALAIVGIAGAGVTHSYTLYFILAGIISGITLVFIAIARNYIYVDEDEVSNYNTNTVNSSASYHPITPASDITRDLTSKHFD